VNRERGQELFKSSNANKLVGLNLVRHSDGTAIVSMPTRAEFLQEKNVVHGGIISMLADTACVYTFLPGLDDSHLPGSIEFKVNFLHPAFLDKGDLVATATTLKRGKSVIVCEAEVVQGDRKIAKGMFTYLISKK